jgi:hypothetical protein
MIAVQTAMVLTGFTVTSFDASAQGALKSVLAAQYSVGVGQIAFSAILAHATRRRLAAGISFQAIISGIAEADAAAITETVSAISPAVLNSQINAALVVAGINVTTVATTTPPSAARSCPSGEFRANNRCSACPKGKHGGATSGGCAKCGAGLFQASPGSTSCIRCAAGLYIPSWDAGAVSSSKCKVCALGKYAFDKWGTGAGNACEWCPAGKFQDYWLQNATRDCKLCPIGQHRNYANWAGYKNKKLYFAKPSCKDCGRGRFALTTGTEKCTWCETGKYNRVKGLSGPCNDCPSHRPFSARPFEWCNVPPQTHHVAALNSLDRCNTSGAGASSGGRSLRASGRELAAADMETVPQYVMGQLVPDADSLNWETGSHFFAMTCFTTIGCTFVFSSVIRTSFLN